MAWPKSPELDNSRKSISFLILSGDSGDMNLVNHGSCPDGCVIKLVQDIGSDFSVNAETPANRRACGISKRNYAVAGDSSFYCAVGR